MDDLSYLGVGLGHRVPLHDDILANADRIDFLEFISDEPYQRPIFLEAKE